MTAIFDKTGTIATLNKAVSSSFTIVANDTSGVQIDLSTANAVFGVKGAWKITGEVSGEDPKALVFVITAGQAQALMDNQEYEFHLVLDGSLIREGTITAEGFPL